MDREFKKDDLLQEKIVQISRVTKVVKGGKNMSFRATVVVGDGEGTVGVGIGKSIEVPKAIRKGIESAKKRQIKVSLVGTTIAHEAIGKLGASVVFLKPAPPGTGVIAGGAVRAILESAGVKDVVSKLQGSSNVINSARATINALENMLTEEKLLKLRGIKTEIRTYAKIKEKKGG
ncbi:MAG: 30S ribosomal protein S5 [Candidatus Margulisbacteria bacterium]|nr:30S ribosomal protein S5 [Candidatus Margulisiibacteriota bacterium]